MKMINPALTMGDVVRAWLPFADTPNVAGPKFRPVIFLGEAEINGIIHWVVAYGTTQMNAAKETKNGADFIIRCMDDKSVVINCDTRFDFNRVHAIPATTDFFSANKKSVHLRVAKIPEALLPQAASSMQSANVGHKLSRLGVRF